MSSAFATFWTAYGDFVSVAFMALSTIVLLYALVDACSSISRTMKRAHKLWDRSDEAVHDFETSVQDMKELMRELRDEKEKRSGA